MQLFSIFKELATYINIFLRQLNKTYRQTFVRVNLSTAANAPISEATIVNVCVQDVSTGLY